MNILTAVNKKYIEPMKNMLYSLAKCNPEKIEIYLLYSNLSMNAINNIERFVKQRCNGNLHPILIDDNFLNGFPIGNHFSIEMYYRIFATEFLANNLDRILWLDSDIVIKGNIQELYYSNFDGYSIIACSHRELDKKYPKVNNEGRERLGLSRDGLYFNSGVILMNLEKIREKFNHQHIIEIINCHKNNLKYPDQDILNLIYDTDVKFADQSIYNYQVHYDWTYINEENFVQNNVKIIHYVGPFKPWGYNSYHNSYKYYWNNQFKNGRIIPFITNWILVKSYKMYSFIKAWKIISLIRTDRKI